MRIGATGRQRLSDRQLQTLSELSKSLGDKDLYTQAHCQRVAQYAMRLAHRIGFSSEDIRNVGIGGLFHDVGKLALSDRIFSNQDTQLPSELKREVRCHPQIGADLLININFFGPAVDFVLFHHEREDGRGYPFGLKAEEIPIGAKIISIADCFDAITTDRPYQKRQSIASAYEILRNGCRRYFCEAYVEVFLEDIEENGIIKDERPTPLSIDELIISAERWAAV